MNVLLLPQYIILGFLYLSNRCKIDYGFFSCGKIFPFLGHHYIKYYA
jgi:hypothetical protein